MIKSTLLWFSLLLTLGLYLYSIIIATTNLHKLELASLSALIFAKTMSATMSHSLALFSIVASSFTAGKRSHLHYSPPVIPPDRDFAQEPN